MLGGDYFRNFTSVCEYLGTNTISLSVYFRILRTDEKHFMRIRQSSFRSDFLKTVN